MCLFHLKFLRLCQRSAIFIIRVSVDEAKEIKNRQTHKVPIYKALLSSQSHAARFQRYNKFNPLMLCSYIAIYLYEEGVDAGFITTGWKTRKCTNFFHPRARDMFDYIWWLYGKEKRKGEREMENIEQGGRECDTECAEGKRGLVYRRSKIVENDRTW